MGRRFWQYATHGVIGNIEADETLRMLGCSGWEAFSVHAAGQNRWLVFLKREMDEVAAKLIDPARTR